MASTIGMREWLSNTKKSPENWPESLVTTVSILLHIKAPACLFWGNDHLFFFNDEYITSGFGRCVTGKIGEPACGENWNALKATVLHVLATGEEIVLAEQMDWVPSTDKVEPQLLTSTCNAIYGSNSRSVGVMVTHSINATPQTRHIEEKYRKAEKLGKMGHWELDLHTGKLDWSDEIYRLFGLPLHAIDPTFDNFLSFVHPDDVAYLKAEQRLALEGEKKFDIEHRIIVNEKIRYLHEAGEIIKDELGQPVLFAGIVQDITEQRNAEEENRFKALLLNTIGQAVIATDLSGTIIYWNKAAAEIYGWTTEEVIGKRIIDVTPSQQSMEEALLIIEQLKRGEPWSGELVLQHKNGTIFPAYITNAPTFDSDENLKAIIGVSKNITERKDNEQKLLEANEELHILTGYLNNAKEEEGKRIAREIHDNLGQQLTALKLEVGALNSMTKNQDEVIKSRFSNINNLLDTSITTIRKISTDLRPLILDDLGLIAALEWQSKEVTERSGVKVYVNANRDFVELPFRLTTGLFRIYQEALTNVVRHSQAKNVSVTLTVSDHRITLLISDDGKGFEQKSVSKSSFGLLGIRERTLLINGTMHLESVAGIGTTITIQVPI